MEHKFTMEVVNTCNDKTMGTYEIYDYQLPNIGDTIADVGISYRVTRLVRFYSPTYRVRVYVSNAW